MATYTTNGIFCLEGDWNHDLRDKTSVQPVLDILSKSVKPRVRTIRRDIGTLTEFEYYVTKWAQKKYRDYPVLYLAFHGRSEELYLGDDNILITLDDLEELLCGKCHNRVIYFGSCGTLDTHGTRINRFMKRTGALAVCGYKADVDWLVSTAFEIILLGAFQWNAMTRAGIQAVGKRVRSDAGGLSRDLQFRIFIARADPSWARSRRARCELPRRKSGR
jgi:hypothetical protein